MLQINYDYTVLSHSQCTGKKTNAKSQWKIIATTWVRGSNQWPHSDVPIPASDPKPLWIGNHMQEGWGFSARLSDQSGYHKQSKAAFVTVLFWYFLMWAETRKCRRCEICHKLTRGMGLLLFYQSHVFPILIIQLKKKKIKKKSFFQQF